jgi:hypothetical protein
MNATQTNAKESGASRSDWFGQLLWPMLFKSVSLAMRPARLIMAYLCLVLIALCIRIPSLWAEKGKSVEQAFSATWPKAMNDFVGAVGDFDPLRTLNAIVKLFVALPALIMEDHPWYDLLAAFVPALIVWSVFACAICRSTAEDHVGMPRRTWTEYLSFAVGKSRSAFFAKAGPLMLAWISLLAVSCVGVLLRVPFLQIVAALFAGLALLIGLLVVLMAAGLILGAPMLIPAVACEGTDAIDANQRTLAYVYGRPLRYVGYLLVVVAMLVAIGTLTSMLFNHGISLAVDAMMRFTGDESRGYLKLMAMNGEEPFSGPEASWHLKSTGTVLSFWVDAWRLLVPAFTLSLFHSASTLLYLLVRKVNDGQEPSELWTGAAGPEVLKNAERESAAASGTGDL